MTNENNEQKLKKVGLEVLKEQSKRIHTTTEHEVVIKDDLYSVVVDDVFEKSKQFKLLDDLVAFFNEGNDDPSLLDFATPYTSMLIIKYFTDVDVPDDIEGTLELMTVMTNLEAIGKFINLMPEEEVINIYELLKDTVGRMNENALIAQEEAEFLSDSLENEELKDMIGSPVSDVLN